MAGKAATNMQLNFKGSTAQLKSMSYNIDGNMVDVTTLADSQHVFEAGLKVEEVTFTVGGYSTWSIHGKGTLALTWNNVTNSDSIASAVLATKEFSGEMDDELTTNMTFRRGT